tara:strand:+ start:1167 stop:1526 length:360 start_codon:yes stop_codon:yes gene_type:complete
VATLVDLIKETYDLKACLEIANSGCSDGACTRHNYQADTLLLYMSYSDEIIKYTSERLGYSFLSNLARDFGSPIKDNKDQDNFSWQDVVSACPNKDDYKHALVWKFIELVAIEKSSEHQ